VNSIDEQMRDLERLALADVALRRDHRSDVAARSQRLTMRVMTCLSCVAFLLAVYDLVLLVR